MRYSTSGEQNLKTSLRLDFMHQLLFTNIYRPPPIVLPEAAVLSCRCNVNPTTMRHPIGRRSETWPCGARITTSPSTWQRRRRSKHAHILIDRAVVEQVESFKFLGVHQLTIMVQTHQDSHGRGHDKAYHPSWDWFDIGPQILKKFCTIESIQTGCITAWYGNCSASKRKALQRVVHTA
jgi:hypothetical protein